MEEETAEHIALKCVNALELLPESTPSIKHLVDGKVYGCLLTILKNQDVKDSNLLNLIPDFEALLKEHFAGPNLVCFEDAVSGSQVELTKLTVLLLYITMLTETKLRSRLVSSPLMDQSTQVKLKYLIESIQKRGSGMGTKFLNILCTEKLDNKSSGRCQTPVSSIASWGSPNVYSNSPKTSSASPLRDLVQSPPFRLQKLLNAKTREAKQLHQQIHSLENDKQEIEMSLEFSHKKISKLKEELLKLQNELQDLRKHCDEIETKMLVGDDLVQHQLHRFGQEASFFRKEHKSLQQTVNQVQENNDELTTKNESLKKRLLLVSAERDRLQEEMSTLYRAKLENENIIESQAYDLKEMKIQLEELRQHLLESKPGNHTIEESFEGGSPMNITDSSPSHSRTCGENMADAVVDKILFETREQLNHLQEQHAALQEKLSETTYSRDQLLAQMEAVTTENEIITYELREVRETHTQLSEAHTQLCIDHKNMLQLLQDTQIKNQKLEAEHQRLENEAKESHITVSNLKGELSQFVDQLSECSSQLKDLEHQLELSQQEVQVKCAAMEKESNARVSLEEELSAKEFKMNEDFQQQIKSLTKEHELQMMELNRNLSTLMGEWERLTQEKTTQKLELQNLKDSHVKARQKMKMDLEEMVNKNGSLSMQIQMQFEAISDMQKETKNKLEALYEEKANLEEKIQLINEEHLKFKCDMEIKVEQMTLEKAALTEEILSKERAHALLTQDMEKSHNTHSDEKMRFDMQMKSMEEAFLTLQNEKEKELEIHAREVLHLNEIIRTKEEGFIKMEKEMHESLEDFMEMKTAMSKELQLKEESYAALQQKMEGNLAEFANEKNELKNAMQQKESSYNLLQLKMQGEDKLNYEKTVLMNEIQAKKGDISKLKKEYELAMESHAQELSLLTEAVRVKEEAVMALQEIVDKLTIDVKVRNDENSALQQQLEIVRVGYEKEKSTYIQDMERKESIYTNAGQGMKNTLESISRENATLHMTIQENEKAFTSLQEQLQKSTEIFSSEKEVISQELHSKMLDLSHLREETMKVQDERSSSVKQLTEELEETTSKYEAQKKINDELRGEIEALKEDISGKVMEHNKILSENQNEMASTIKHINSLLSEKDIIIKTLEEQKEENKQKYESKIAELEVTLDEKYKCIDFIEQEKIGLNKSIRDIENRFLEELHTTKLALEVLQRESEKQTQSSEKTISELGLSLKEKVNSVTAIKEEYEQSQLTHKAQMDEIEAEIAGHRSAFLEKEEEFRTRITVLREQVSSLESHKMRTAEELKEQAIKVKALVLKLNRDHESPIKAEREKENAVEVHEQEKASMNGMIKVLEDAVNALQQQVKEAFEIHGKEKAVITEKFQEKEVALASLQKDMESYIITCSEEKALLSKETQEKEKLILNQKQDIQNLHAQLKEEKKVLGKEIQEKENACMSVKHEMESATEVLNDKKNRQLKEKEDLIIHMQKERENLIAEHAKEKASLNDIIREKEEALSSLQGTLHINTDTFTFEKETLQKELQSQQECYTLLKDNYEKTQESIFADATMYTVQIQEKEKEISSLHKELKKVQESNKARIKQLEGDLGKISSCLESEQKLNVDLNCTIHALKEEFAVKDTEHIKSLTERQQELSDEVSRLNHCITERNQMYENLKKQHVKETQSYRHEVLSLQEDVAEKIQLVTSLEQEIIGLKKNNKSILQEMDNNSTENTSLISSLKKDINDLQKILTQKEKDMLEELSITKNALEMIQKEKKKQEETHEERIAKLNECLTEKSAIISTLKQETEQIQSEHKAILSCLEQKYAEEHQNEDKTVAALNAHLTRKSEAVNSVKEELEHIHSFHEIQLGKANDLMKEQEAKMKAALTALENKLKSAQEEIVKHTLHIQTLEAKLIDKEQDITAAREEVMQVERESEKSNRSLAEELTAMKEKFRSEKKAVADRMKMSYRTEVEKLMIQIEELEQMSKEKEIIFQKYEAAKKKLTEVFAKLDEAKTINEDYEKQITKYKELVTKLQSDLQKELSKRNEMLSRITELECKYQPLKEKLHESENTVRRIGNEKRSLEVQLLHAEAQMKEIKKQWERESFGGIHTQTNTYTMGSHSASSDTQHSDIVVTRPSSSSCEDDWNIDDSTKELLPSRSSKETRKTMLRVASAETMFRKPGKRTSYAENKQTNESVKQTTSTADKKKALQPSEINVSDKSLGRSVPRDMLFNCEDEEELFSNKYLLDMKVGRCNPMNDAQWKRLSELQRRNSLYPPHMRSAYPAEMQFRPLQDFEDDKLREGCAVEDRHLLNLTQATENLGLDSPAYNLRKRKSLSDSECSFGSSGGRKTKRLSTSYSRPGPPTPGRKSLSRIDKENRRASSASDLSLSSLPYRGRKGSPQPSCSGGSPVSTRLRHARGSHSSHSVSSPSTKSPHSTRSPGNITVVSKKGATPRGKRGMTPSSLRKILSKGKSPWRKLDNEQETPKVLGDSTGSNGSTKLRIFRRPFGSRNYSVLSASLRSQENPNDLNDSSTASIGHSNPAITEKLRGRR